MKRIKWWVLLGLILVTVGVVGIAMEKFPFLPGANALVQSNVVYEDNAEISYEQAQEAYHTALESLADRQWEQALQQLEPLEKPYVRLRPMIRFHQAQAHAELGDESQAQEKLQLVIAEHSGSMIATLAQYRLGQSAMRGGQPGIAKTAFQHVTKNAPQTSIAAGSHFYLGQLAEKEGEPEVSRLHYLAYLKTATNGTFSLAAAKGLEQVAKPMTPEEHLYVGQTYFENDQFAKAAEHLKKAPFQQAWLALGKSTLKLKHYQEGLTHLTKGLQGNVKQAEAEDAIRQIFWNTDPNQRVTRFKQLLTVPELKGKDFVLWQLQLMSSGPAKVTYAKQLVSQHPNSNWAPESSWLVAWADFKAGQKDAFAKRAQTHIQQYPYSRSAPKAMFWLAKHYQQNGSPAKAGELYRELIARYPNQFYAFRAQQIVEQVNNPFRTDPSRSYPPDSGQEEIDPEKLAHYVGYRDLVPLTAELIHIGADTDVELIAGLTQKEKLSPPLESWIYQNRGDYAKSIRVIRDYLEEQRKAGKPIEDETLNKLLYPVLFTDEISEHARNNHLDPFLVQALARQESYFNPLAVSSSNAMGLMQLLPSTARDVAQWEKLPQFHATELFQPNTNVRLGTRYLRFLHERFNGNSMLSVGAYNGGPGAMGRWVQALSPQMADPDLFIESIPYDQSKDYIKEVYSHYWNYQQLYDEQRLSQQ